MGKNPVFVGGVKVELLSVTAGKVNETPVGILTVRPDPNSLASIPLMFDRSALERLQEDIAYILKSSTYLAEGMSRPQSLTLKDVEGLNLARPRNQDASN